MKKRHKAENKNRKSIIFIKKNIIIVGMLFATATASCCNRAPEQANTIETIITLDNPEILNPSNINSDNLYYPIPETPSNAQENTEVTTDDLINTLNYLCYVKNKYDRYFFKDLMGENYNYLSTNFVSISSELSPNLDEEVKSIPFYFSLDDFYTININYQTAQGKTDEGRNLIQVEISKEELEPILNHLGIPKFELTREYLEQLGLIECYKPLIGTQVYDGTQELDIEVLCKITDSEVIRILVNFANKQTNQYIDKINKLEEVSN